MASYRKTKQGEWVVFGPATEVCVGQVSVTKKGGDIKVESVVRVGKPFDVNGIAHCYGHIAPRQVGFRSSGALSREEKTCWECGCRFTYSDCRQSGGDWKDGYCGC